MVSCHGANPIFFNKKIKIGRPEHSLLILLRPITSYFCLTPTHSQSGRHMCDTPKIDTEAYLESYQPSKMERFDENSYEDGERLKVVNYFCKKLHLRCLTGP